MAPVYQRERHGGGVRGQNSGPGRDKKGAFIITSDGARRDWKIEGPHFGGWEVLHVRGSPADPDRLYASQSTDWHGQVMQRSDDGGKSWEAVGNEFSYDGATGTHQWYDGPPHPWEFKRAWHLKPSPSEPNTIFVVPILSDSEHYPPEGKLRVYRSHSGGNEWEALSKGLPPRTCGRWRESTPR